MRFTAEKSTIIAAIDTASRYAAKNESIPVLAHICLKAADGRVEVTATDLDRAAQTSFPAEVSAAGEYLLPAAHLLRIVKDAAGTEVSIDANDTQATVKSGRSSYKLPTLLTTAFPSSPMMTKSGASTFEIPGDIVRRVAVEVAPNVFTEKGREYISGVYWHADEKGLHFVGTDGAALSHVSMEAPAGSDAMPGVIVPVFQLPDWDEAVTVDITEDFIRFSSAGVTVASKLIDARFPEYWRIIPTWEGTSVEVDKDEFLSAIKRTIHFADRTKKAIRIEAIDGELWFRSSCQSGSAEEVIRCEGDDAYVIMGALDVLPLLAGWRSQRVRLRIKDAASMVMMEDPADDRKTTLFMPMPDFATRAAA